MSVVCPGFARRFGGELLADLSTVRRVARSGCYADHAPLRRAPSKRCCLTSWVAGPCSGTHAARCDWPSNGRVSQVDRRSVGHRPCAASPGGVRDYTHQAEINKSKNIAGSRSGFARQHPGTAPGASRTGNDPRSHLVRLDLSAQADRNRTSKNIAFRLPLRPPPVSSIKI